MNALLLLTKIKSLDIPTIARKTINDSSEYIADRNAEQLARGISADGKPTTLNGSTQYAPLTVKIKSEKTGLSAVTDRITGYDTGSMYRDLYAQVQGNQIEYGSRSDTARLFEAKAGSRIFGLTDENREDVINNRLLLLFLAEIERKLS